MPKGRCGSAREKLAMRICFPQCLGQLPEAIRIRHAPSDEVKDLRRKANALKGVVAELPLYQMGANPAKYL
jgi:hypothetical protein